MGEFILKTRVYLGKEGLDEILKGEINWRDALITERKHALYSLLQFRPVADPAKVTDLPRMEELIRVWREEIIPWTQVNQNSAAVVLTDNLYGTYNFNTGAASMLEGRAFTQAEYDTGALVCLVSAGFARHNGLAVGDEIAMDFYDTEINRTNISHGIGFVQKNVYICAVFET